MHTQNSTGLIQNAFLQFYQRRIRIVRVIFQKVNSKKHQQNYVTQRAPNFPIHLQYDGIVSALLYTNKSIQIKTPDILKTHYFSAKSSKGIKERKEEFW